MHTEKYKIKSNALKKMISSCKPEEKIIDYGCGTGNLLRSFKIDPSNYLGIDVDINNIHKARENFPDYEFTWFNMYNPVYNKNGADLPPVLPKKYFIKGIVAYSVFSHTTLENMMDIINSLIGYKKSYEKIELLLSFVTFDNIPMLQYFQHKRLQKYGKCDSLIKESFGDPMAMYLVNNQIVQSTQFYEKLNKEGNTYWDNVEEFVTIYNKKEIISTLIDGIEDFKINPCKFEWEEYKGQQNILHIEMTQLEFAE